LPPGDTPRSPGSEMTGGVKNVYARDLTMNSANLQAGHRIKTNTRPGGHRDAGPPHHHHVDRGQLRG